MLRTGDMLGAYELDELVGRGATGVMFRARDVRLGRTVALRVVDPELGSDPVVRARLNRESTVVAQIDHPNVVPLYEAEELDGRLCLASRWVDGRSLARLISEDGPLEPRRAVRLVGQVASALQAAHDLDMLHRDVKASNVLVTAGDHAYLTDFCLARRSTDTVGLTAPEELSAQLDYVAPELISGEEVDRRLDVYGLGLVLYEALTGEVPFPRPAAAAKVYAHLNEQPPLIRPRRPQVPAALDAVVQRALAKDPEDRQPTAAAFAAEAFDAVDLTRPVWTPGGSPAAAADPRERPFDTLEPLSPATPAATAAPRPGEPFHRYGGNRRRVARWAAIVALALVSLAVPALLIASALRDDDPAPAAAGAGASDVAVVAGRVWIAPRNGDVLEFAPTAKASDRTPYPLEAGRISGVAAGDGRLLAAAEQALIEVGSGDAPAAVRIPLEEPVGALAVGGGSSWAATRERPGLLRVAGGRASRIPLTAPASALAVGADTLWIADAGAGTVFGVDTATRIATTEKVRVGDRPVALAASGDAVWVALAGDQAVVRLDPATGEPDLDPVELPGRPVALVADERRVWVAVAGREDLTVLDARTGEAADEAPGVPAPVALAMGGSAVWVAGRDGAVRRVPR